jgi:uncharacterized protein with HEPN domain
MPPEIAKYLNDIYQACLLLEAFTQGKTFNDYQADPQLRSAVERQFIVIGEALMQAERKEPALGQSISDLRKIIAFRNLLVHGYATIQNATVWGVVENDLAILKRQTEDLLKQAGPP